MWSKIEYDVGYASIRWVCDNCDMEKEDMVVDGQGYCPFCDDEMRADKVIILEEQK